MGIVVERTLAQSREVEVSNDKDEMRDAAKRLVNLKDILKDMDSDGDGHVSVGEFEAALQDDERVWESFRCLGIPTDDVQSLYEIFDTDDNGSLSVEEVLEGC